MKSKYTFGAVTIFVVFTVTSIAFTNCSRVAFQDRNSEIQTIKSDETIVGNPMTGSKKLLTNFCSVIIRCHPDVSVSQCETGVMKTTGIDYQVGLTKGSVGAFSEILNSESSGALQANATALSSCQSAVDNLLCSDSKVQAAYNASNADPFSGLAFMIPTMPGSCPALFNQPKAQTEYFVATTGDDSNDGSAERPWATITKASLSLVPGPAGALVHVAPGTYSQVAGSSCGYASPPCTVITTRNGTAAAPITYISDQNWKAKIVATGASTAWYNSGSYVKIIGFEVVGSQDTEYGIFSESTYSQILSNHIHSIPVTKNCAKNFVGSGIFFGFQSSTHDNDAIGNLIHDIGPVNPDGLPPSTYCRFGDGITVEQPGGKIQNNIIYRTSGWGIETWNNSSKLQISHNLIFKTGYRTSTGSLGGGAITLGSDSAVTIHNDSTVSNNILRDNSGVGLTEMGAGPRNRYVNNLMFSNGQDFRLVSGISPEGTITKNPLMINFQVDGSGNYQLMAGSPAIDAGSLSCDVATGNGNCTPEVDFAGSARPYGLILDVGPFEWHP